MDTEETKAADQPQQPKRRASRTRKVVGLPPGDVTTKSTKRKGRPRGAGNRQFAEVAELPACCPRCHSDKLKMLPGKPVIEREYPGVIAGQQFSLVRWRDTQCECGQFVRVRQYLRQQQPARLSENDSQ